MPHPPASTAAYRRTGLSRAALPWLVVVVLLAQLLWQTLGHMHGLVHFPAAHWRGHLHAGHASTGHDPAHADMDDAHPAATGWVAALVGHAGDESTCRLLDQLGHGDTLAGTASLWLPLQPAAALLLTADCEARARWAALFDARGPPATR